MKAGNLAFVTICLLVVQPGLLAGVNAQQKAAAKPMNENAIKVLINDEVGKVREALKKEQETKLSLYQEDFKLKSQKIEQKLENIHWTIKVFGGMSAAGVLTLVVTALYYYFRSIPRRIERKVTRYVREEFEKRDPRYWQIPVPRQDFELEKLRLENLGFNHLVPVTGLEPRWNEGVIVYPAQSDDDLVKLKQFIERENIDPWKCCFVIYVKTKEDLELSKLSPFDNYVLCKMPSTLSEAIYTASRNLVY